MSLAQLHSEKLLAGLLPKPLPLSLIISVSLLSTIWASAADPLGATPHSDGSTTFRVGPRLLAALPSKFMAETGRRLARGMATRIPQIPPGSAQFPGPGR